MNRVEAMEWAADYAERNKIFEAPKNDRGYTKDGWKDPTPAEKANIISQLAENVVEEPGKPNYQALARELGNLATYLEQAKSLDPVRFETHAVQATHDRLVELWKELKGD